MRTWSKTEIEVLSAARAVGAHLLKNFPPENYFIINYGPPTAVTSAYFREVMPDLETRRHYYRELMMMKSSIGSEMEQESVRFAILDAILPPDSILNGRTIVIHRYLWEGTTLRKFINFLQSYIAQRRPGLKIALALMISNDRVHLEHDLSRLWPFYMTVQRLNYHPQRLHLPGARMVFQRLADTQFVTQEELDIANLQEQLSQPNRKQISLSHIQRVLPRITKIEGQLPKPTHLRTSFSVLLEPFTHLAQNCMRILTRQ